MSHGGESLRALLVALPSLAFLHTSWYTTHPYPSCSIDVIVWFISQFYVDTKLLRASVLFSFRLRQLCRRIQSRSRSEDFQSHVATAADAPLGEPTRTSRQGPGGATPASGARRGSDFRQPLMHDNDEAQDMLMRSRVLFAQEQQKQEHHKLRP